MENNGLKNIVVLKNIPSNIVDEAIVILKQNKKTKRIEVVDNNKINKSTKKTKEPHNYVLKEAEMIISSYISKIEKREQKKTIERGLNQRYKRLKKFAVLSNIVLLVSLVLNFIHIIGKCN